MGRKRQHVDVKFPDVYWDMSHRLHRVGVEIYAVFMGDLCDFGDRFHGADLVVGIHHRNQGGVGLYRLF
ncbi:hypothetical protein SDC9_157641 [bioreactor metagenome]|uniref:Uncharacterized protein n=1 Tax=bioreactor metagenome TaxID=1076179 RepID=A0A645F9P7_9ZZZZ